MSLKDRGARNAYQRKHYIETHAVRRQQAKERYTAKMDDKRRERPLVHAYDLSLAERQRRKSKGLCYYCASPAESGFTLCRRHREYQSVKNAQSRARLREEIFQHYGGKCACCREFRTEFLTIDHVNNDGAKHRKETKCKTGITFYGWLKRNSYPSGFQVLCWNCNCAKRINGGVCPHKTKKRDYPVKYKRAFVPDASTENLNSIRICAHCQEPKPLSEFYTQNGKRYWKCKSCHRQSQLEYARSGRANPSAPQDESSLKHCRKCGEEKPLRDFGSSHGRASSPCKRCRNKAVQQWRDKKAAERKVQAACA